MVAMTCLQNNKDGVHCFSAITSLKYPMVRIRQDFAGPRQGKCPLYRSSILQSFFTCGLHMTFNPNVGVLQYDFELTLNVVRTKLL